MNPTHPIAQGVPNPIIIDAQEMYGEFFDIPAPDELIFISSFTGGEVFRSGCTFRRGHGKIFFFSPGDQDYPVYHHTDVRRVIANGVGWVNSDRPERAVPTLLRYETDDFFNGHGYTGPIEDARRRGGLMPSPTDRIKIIQVGAGAMGRAWLDVHRRVAGRGAGRSGRPRPVGGAAVGGRCWPAQRSARTPRWPSCSPRWQRTPSLNVTVPEAHAEVSITALRHGLAGAVREAPGRHGGRSTVYGRCRRGRRSAADGLPVAALLA